MIKNLLRKNILSLLEKKEMSNKLEVQDFLRLDINKNPFGSPLPQNYHEKNDVLAAKIKTQIAQIKGVPAKNIFLGNGNWDLVSALMTAFCEPYRDNIILNTPSETYFSDIAEIQAVQARDISLITDYQLDIQSIANAIDDGTKIIFLVSPNNPTGNSLARHDLEIILNNFDGLVVLDESYINYARQRSFCHDLKEYPNLVILQNFDTAWASAAANVAMAFADETLIDIFKTILPPYTVSQPALEIIEKTIFQIEQINQWTKDTVMLRNYLSEQMSALPIVKKVYPSETNFILVRFNVDVNKIYDYLIIHKIAVTNCHNILLCENCLRISVGTILENDKFIYFLKKYIQEQV
jgi:histidinol-phosphate aminotransferase